eukprot:6188840-Pleurochrysis_carterae.AAC.1
MLEEPRPLVPARLSSWGVCAVAAAVAIGVNLCAATAATTAAAAAAATIATATAQPPTDESTPSNSDCGEARASEQHLGKRRGREGVAP